MKKLSLFLIFCLLFGLTHNETTAQQQPLPRIGMAYPLSAVRFHRPFRPWKLSVNAKEKHY